MLLLSTLFSNNPAWLSESIDVIIESSTDLVCLPVVLLGGILELLDGGVEAIGLSLQRLHLLPDGVHGGGLV